MATSVNYRWSEIFSIPTALEKPRHVTSALEKQGSDRLEPATHLHQGALRLLAYRSVTADQAQLNMNMDHFALSVHPQKQSPYQCWKSKSIQHQYTKWFFGTCRWYQYRYDNGSKDASFKMDLSMWITKMNS